MKGRTILYISITLVIVGISLGLGLGFGLKKDDKKNSINDNIKFYNDNIQLDKNVIEDIFNNFTPNSKMLVFGLGYDSKMWFNGNKNTYFIEDNIKYIKLNEKDIPHENIIEYKYDTTVKNSFNLTDEDISNFKFPSKLNELAPFDIILIDGPEGHKLNKVGRLLPCYFSTLLSKKNTIIYVDDSSRKLEKYCIDKYFKDKQKKIFKNRLQCTKIYY